MLLKLSAVGTKFPLPVNRVWSAIAAYVGRQRQRSRDRRILLNLNDHALRDLALTKSRNNTFQQRY